MSNCSPPTSPEFCRLISILTCSETSPVSDEALRYVSSPMVIEPLTRMLLIRSPSPSLTERSYASN